MGGGGGGGGGGAAADVDGVQTQGNIITHQVLLA